MSRHPIPADGARNNPKDTTDVSQTSASTREQTTSSGEEPAETAVEVTAVPTEPGTGSGAEPAEPLAESAQLADQATPGRAERKVHWTRVVAYGVLPGIALVLALAAGYLKWQDNSVRDSDSARAEAVQTAKDSTVRMLSYKAESVDKDLNSARDLLTGDFRDQYTALINDVVIPGARQKHISAAATVPAAGSVSADPDKAVVLVFVNQTVVVGQDAPTDTASSVRVTLEKAGDRWLISQFDAV